MERTRIKIVGQSGSGLLTAGDLVAKGLQKLGFQLCADREYQSLIKGGHSCYTINFSKTPVHSLSREADILVAIDKPSLVAYFDTLKEEGIFLHGYEKLANLPDILKKIEEQNIKTVNLPSRKIALENGGTMQMANIILTGMAWKVLGFDYKIIEQLVQEKFSKKKALVEVALKCLKASYDGAETKQNIELPTKKEETILLDGNHAIALGAINAGMRFYATYPMSPSSSILTHVANMSDDTGVVVKQAEDEITAVQMSLGAMFAGTRALTATSGGGYDLMTESVSLAGIIENPLVIVLAQRPGPGTGLPTWTAQGDLNLAIHSSHGEFPRVVIACSDVEDCFDNVQHAFNFAEKYQVPVILLTEKVVCESKMTVSPFTQNKIKIERGLASNLADLKPEDRYRITENGLSTRWLPGSCDTTFFANGDEHDEAGVLDESEKAGDMYAKRMRKLDLIQADLPKPKVYGKEKDADISFVGWGSTKTVMNDIIAQYEKKGVSVNFLHFEVVWPLEEEVLNTFFVQNKNVHLLEGNYEGQFGKKVEACGHTFKNKFLKWNGRPFFLEDVCEYIDNYAKQ
jgi:2-oxoglutarate/2-oxoacid ferredoxin oxidoreductase subunit alpha